MTYHLFKLAKRFRQLPYGLVVRIRRSHRRGPGSIPGVIYHFYYNLPGQNRFEIMLLQFFSVLV